MGQRGAVAGSRCRTSGVDLLRQGVENLSLSEAATIAGMNQGPSRYSPERKREAAQARRNWCCRHGHETARLALSSLNGCERSNRRGGRCQNIPIAKLPISSDYVNRVAESQLEVSGATSRSTRPSIWICNNL